MSGLATPAYAAALGWVAGMRSMTPPALLARTLADRRGVARLLGRRQPARALGSEAAQTLLPLAALGEIVADKLPMTPARTSPAALAGRLATGALAGAALAAGRREDPAASAVAGAVAAVASSFAMMALRKRAGEALDVPDPVVALAEDALAVGAGLAVVAAALD